MAFVVTSILRTSSVHAVIGHHQPPRETWKDAVVFGLMEKDDGPIVHGVLLMEEPDKAKSAIQQANKQLASQQQIRGFTVWPDQDFPRTHTLKVKRPEVLERLQSMRSEVQ